MLFWGKTSSCWFVATPIFGPPCSRTSKTRSSSFLQSTHAILSPICLQNASLGSRPNLAYTSLPQAQLQISPSNSKHYCSEISGPASLGKDMAELFSDYSTRSREEEAQQAREFYPLFTHFSLAVPLFSFHLQNPGDIIELIFVHAAADNFIVFRIRNIPVELFKETAHRLILRKNLSTERIHAIS